MVSSSHLTVAVLDVLTNLSLTADLLAEVRSIVADLHVDR